MKKVFFFIISINLLLADKNITIYDFTPEMKEVRHIETDKEDKKVKIENILNSDKIKDDIEKYQMNFNKFNKNKLSYQLVQLIIYTLFYLFIMFLFIFLFRYKVKNIYTENSLYYDDSKRNESFEVDNNFDFSHIKKKETIIEETFIFNRKNFISIFIALIFIIFYYLWYVFIYTYSIEEQYKYRIMLENQINIKIIDKQNKINSQFFKKLTKDTETLSSIVDLLQETREIGSDNNNKFIQLINQLNEQIKENNHEMKALQEIKPIRGGTIIQFGD